MSTNNPNNRKLGIGTSTPSTTLHVCQKDVGNGDGITLTHNNSHALVQQNSATGLSFKLLENGDQYYGFSLLNSSGDKALSVTYYGDTWIARNLQSNGNITATGDIYTTNGNLGIRRSSPEALLHAYNPDPSKENGIVAYLQREGEGDVGISFSQNEVDSFAIIHKKGHGGGLGFFNSRYPNGAGNEVATISNTGFITASGDIKTLGRMEDKTGYVMPVGSIIAYGAKNASQPPVGWLFCDGNTIDKNLYPELYNLIGANTPKLNGRTLIGAGKPDLGVQSDGKLPNFLDTNNFYPGWTGGEYQHKLTSDEMPSHTHELTPIDYSGGWNEKKTFKSLGGSDRDGTAINSNSAGSDAFHNNMQPYHSVYYIIKC